MGFGVLGFRDAAEVLSTAAPTRRPHTCLGLRALRPNGLRGFRGSGFFHLVSGGDCVRGFGGWLWGCPRAWGRLQFSDWGLRASGFEEVRLGARFGLSWTRAKSFWGIGGPWRLGRFEMRLSSFFFVKGLLHHRATVAIPLLRVFGLEFLGFGTLGLLWARRSSVSSTSTLHSPRLPRSPHRGTPDLRTPLEG